MQQTTAHPIASGEASIRLSDFAVHSLARSNVLALLLGVANSRNGRDFVVGLSRFLIEPIGVGGFRLQASREQRAQALVETVRATRLISSLSTQESLNALLVSLADQNTALLPAAKTPEEVAEDILADTTVRSALTLCATSLPVGVVFIRQCIAAKV